MITPAYAITASERVLPKLALDFTTGVLDPRVTVTRALNTATSVNSSGYIETVNANLPRFSYDAITLAPKGLLIEEARVNSMTYSEDMSTWTTSGASVSTNQVTAPNNTLTADALIEDSATSEHFAYSNAVSITPSGYVSQSIFIRANGRNAQVRMQGSNAFAYIITNVDLSNSTYSTPATYLASNATVTIEPYKESFYRVTITGVFDASVTSVRAYVYLLSGGVGGATNYLGNGTSGVYLWGAQIEAGAFATSYIPNLATGTTTRNADDVGMTGTNFSDWYNASNGAFVAWFDTVRPAGVGYIYSANAGGSFGNSIYQSAYANTTDNYVISGGTQQARLLSGTITANTQAKTGLRYANADFATAANGGALQTQLSGSLPVGVDRLNIGQSAGGGNFLNGHAAKLFWYASLTNAELVAFTK